MAAAVALGSGAIPTEQHGRSRDLARLATLAYLESEMGFGSDAPAGLRVIESGPTFSLGEFERCLICDWRLQPTEFDTRNAALVELAQRHPGNCAYLEMIEPSSKPPPSPLRKQGMDVFRRLGLNLSCVAVVVHGTEMRSALVRAVLTGMTFLIPQFQPARVFRDVEATARWMRPRLGMDLDFDRRFADAAEFLRPRAAVVAHAR